VSSLKKTLRKIRKVTKKLGKKEKEVLLRGLQDFLHQGEQLLRRAAKASAPKKASKRASRSRRGKPSEKTPSTSDGASSPVEAGNAETPANAP
jgi:hypothetical protein